MMLASIAVTVLLSIIVFIGVSLFVGLGVLWWTGDVARGALIRSDQRHGRGFYGRRGGHGQRALEGALRRRPRAISGWS